MNGLAAEFDGFRVERHPRLQRGDLVLNRPPYNVVSFPQRDAMAAVLRELDKDASVRVIVLRAEGDHFSSGGDIPGFMRETPEELSRLAENVMTPEKLRKPVIAAIQGYCFGVGLGFSLACDIRIVADTAQLSLPEMKIGMIPGSGGSARLAKMIGLARVKDMIMRGRRLSARSRVELVHSWLRGTACGGQSRRRDRSRGAASPDRRSTIRCRRLPRSDLRHESPDPKRPRRPSTAARPVR